MSPTVRSVALALLLLLPQAAAKTLHPDIVRMLRFDQQHDDGDDEDPDDPIISFTMTDLCNSADEDGDRVFSLTFCETKYTIDTNCNIGTDTCPVAREPHPWVPHGVAGDPDDGNANNPIPYDDANALPESVLTLLVWAIQEGTAQANAALAQATAFVEETRQTAEQAREAAEEEVDDSFPIWLGLPDATAPQDADGDDAWTTTIRTCTYQIQRSGSVTKTGCDGGFSLGDPDDRDAANPVDRDQLVSDVVGGLLALVSDTVADVQRIVDDVQEDTLESIDDLFDDTFPLVLPYPVLSISNNDGDLVSVVEVIEGSLRLERDGSYTITYGTTALVRFGDPDDGDGENPVAGLPADPFDWDGDGWTNEDEAVHGGSHPFTPTSRLDTDDDGDGIQNMNTYQVLPAAWTGAYGLVAASRTPYEDPPGYPGASPVFVQPGVPARVWVWDSACWPALEYRYDACQSSTALPTFPYSGDWTGDGYGWRWAASLYAFPQTVDVVGPCSGMPRDNDGDGVPVVQFCQRTYSVYPDGRVVPTSGETPLAPPAGDYDDADPSAPLPLSGLGGLVESLQRQGTALVDEVLGLVMTLPVMAQEVVRDLGELSNQTLEDAAELRDRLLALAQKTEADLAEAGQGLIDEAEGIDALVACLSSRVTDYQDRLVQHVSAYVNDPTEARLTQVRSDLVYGSTALVLWLDECETTTELEELVQRRYESAVALAGEFLGSLAEALGTGDGARDLIIEYLGATGEIAQGVLDETLDAAHGSIVAVASLLEELPGLIDDTLHEYAEHPWEQTIQDVYDEVAGSEAATGRSSLEFHVVDRDGHSLNATLIVKRLGRVVAAGATDTSGTYRVRLDASTSYTYVVASEGHRGAEGTARTPAEGETQRIEVVLATTQQVVADTWGPWLVGGLVVVFVVLVARRRRRA